MSKRQKNKNHGTEYSAGIKIMISELGNVFCCHMRFCHGASGIAWRKKLSSSVDMALLPIISLSTLTGFKPLSFAVRIMVMMIETLRLGHRGQTLALVLLLIACIDYMVIFQIQPALRMEL